MLISLMPVSAKYLKFRCTEISVVNLKTYGVIIINTELRLQAF